MDTIQIEATERSPAIEFDFNGNSFLIKGESYPEDVTAFYGPIFEKLEKHLHEQNGSSIQFTFDLIYFNSSTAKILMGLFETLDEAGENNDVTVVWKYEVDDDNMEEMGEEFGEDLENAKFVLKEVPAE